MTKHSWETESLKKKFNLQEEPKNSKKNSRKYIPKTAFGSRLKNVKKMQKIIEEVEKKEKELEQYFHKTYEYPFFYEPTNKEC